MEIGTIMEYVGVYGVNTVITVALLAFCYITQKQNKETVEKLIKSHQEETQKMQDVVINNTAAITELSAYIKGGFIGGQK